MYDLGLEEQIVGVTRFCVHPPSARKDKITGWWYKDSEFRSGKTLQEPDLVLGNQEEELKCISSFRKWGFLAVSFFQEQRREKQSAMLKNSVDYSIKKQNMQIGETDFNVFVLDAPKRLSFCLFNLERTLDVFEWGLFLFPQCSPVIGDQHFCEEFRALF